MAKEQMYFEDWRVHSVKLVDALRIKELKINDLEWDLIQMTKEKKKFEKLL